MLDINAIRENPEQVKNSLLKRMDEVDFTQLLEDDKQCRELKSKADQFKERRNKVSKEIPQMKKRGEDCDDLFSEMKQLGQDIKDIDDKIRTLQGSIDDFLLRLPNIPAEDVPAGGKESNVVLRTWGEKRQFGFPVKNHVDLVTDLGLIDYKRGVKIGGTNNWLYTGDGARLEWGLLNFFITEHLKDGWQFMLPPHMLTNDCGTTAGQFPKFADDVFHIGDDHFLLPTSETALVNIHRDEILPRDQLPMRYFAYSPCYRKEAGSYRANERGMIRGHQFNKVELFVYSTPEQSGDLLEEMIGKAESLVQQLGLHYQVSRLAAKDCSASMAKTLDIEVWIPSMESADKSVEGADGYKEVSSASNSFTYQARRGNIRFKDAETGKNHFLHTLNASGLATSRIIPAIVEQFQQEDGSVLVPEVLQQWVGKERFSPVR